VPAAPRIAVVGAGAAGLTCARALADAGRAPRVYEKSRGIGGRVATRRRAGWQVDHGAQALHLAPGDPLAAGGHLARWPDSATRVGVPEMKAPLRPLAAGLDIAFGAEVCGLARAEGGWFLTTAQGAAQVDRVVLAMPAPQALRLLPGTETSLRAELAAVRFASCHALLLVFETPPGWPEATTAPFGPFAGLWRDSAKPGRPPGEAWVAHTTPDWSRAHLAAGPSPEVTCATLCAALAEARGPLPPLRAAEAHRWRLARTETALGRPYAASADGTLVVGGDWALGPDIAHARASGAAMACAVLSGLPAAPA